MTNSFESLFTRLIACPHQATKVARIGNTLLPFSATFVASVDRLLGYRSVNAYPVYMYA